MVLSILLATGQWPLASTLILVQVPVASTLVPAQVPMPAVIQYHFAIFARVSARLLVPPDGSSISQNCDYDKGHKDYQYQCQ
jgi:hypothetical protein